VIGNEMQNSTTKNLGKLARRLGVVTALTVSSLGNVNAAEARQECKYIIEAPNLTNIPTSDTYNGQDNTGKGYMTIFLPESAIKEYFPSAFSKIKPGNRISLNPMDVRKLASNEDLVRKLNSQCKYVTMDNNDSQCNSRTIASHFRRSADENTKDVYDNGQWNLLLEGKSGLFTKPFSFEHTNYGHFTGEKCRK
jgi:23S rRNA pseudoU1915 N3-methylase RlmH